MLRRMCIFLASFVLAAASALISASAADAAPMRSADWSGYAASGAHDLLQATWVLPAVSCTSGNQYSSVWVGLDGYTSSTIEQIGTEADCSNGTPVYYAWYQFYPDQRHTFSEPVQPGDEVTAFSHYNPLLKSYDMGILDYTGRWSEHPRGVASGPPPSSAEVIVGLPPVTAAASSRWRTSAPSPSTKPWSRASRSPTPTRRRSSWSPARARTRTPSAR
ncbi:G1 family glutamic endopeptidase [Streptomyces sp. NPDC047061]|uniref:G1 family glutamic endopeptidase n=1 Tax=Streptomyces sp. NPDC047061 TaxID=3154605 RepID=UPI0033F267F1